MKKTYILLITLAAATLFCNAQEEPTRYIVIEEQEKTGIPEDMARLSPGERRYAASQRSDYDRIISTFRLSDSTVEKLRAAREVTSRKLNMYVARDLLRENSPELKIWGIKVLEDIALVNDVQQVKVNPEISGTACKMLLPLLCSESAKVRFFASLLLYKITGNNYSYRYNDARVVRDQAAALWAQNIANAPEFSVK